MEFLDSLVANRLMVSDDTNYLSLAVPARLPAKRRSVKNMDAEQKVPTALSVASADLVLAELG